MAISGYTFFSILVLSLFASSVRSQEIETKEFVLTLDHTNFTETINKHVFIVFNFYESWCKNCKELAYEYEKAASELNRHVPPVVLAKFDATTETNKELANGYKIAYFPTIKIFRYGGKLVECYNGPNKAENIEVHLKRQSKKPIPSLEIKSVNDAAEMVKDEEIVVVGIFPKLSGSEFNSFLMIAHNLGSDYNFAHTLDAKLLPRGESFVTGPTLRLFKPFDELFVDFKDFDEKTLEKFVKESSIPLVTVLDKDPNNNPFVNMPYTKSMTGKVMLIINFTGEAAESLKSKYREVATSNQGQGLRFLLGDAEASQGTLKFFGHRESQIPLIIIETYMLNYLKANVEVDQIESWINDFKDGKLVPHKKPSLEMKSAYDIAADVIVDNISDNKVVVVGIFPKLSGPEFDSFLATAEKMRSEFDFVHTSKLEFFPRKEPFMTGPLVRLLKPFVECFADFNDFNGEALEKFVKESSIPLVTVFDKNYPNNQPYVIKFFENSNIKVMLYMNFTGEGAESLKSKYREVATSNKEHGLSFLLGNAENTQDVFEFYGLHERQVPLIIIQTVDKKKYLKANVEVNQIESWVNDFKDGKLVLYKKSQPIPTVNNEPVKVVVSKSLDDMFFNSGKNVLLEFYDPKCGPCQKLVPIMDEVAVSYQSDQSVVIAKLDITANDFPRDIFNAKSVPSVPTIYFRLTSGNIVVYEGNMTKEDIISFIDNIVIVTESEVKALDKTLITAVLTKRDVGVDEEEEKRSYHGYQ